MAGLLIIGFGPMILEFFANLWERPYYQFFPMALGGAVLLARRGLLELPRPLVPSAMLVTLTWLGASLVLLSLALLIWSPWLASLSAVACLVGLALGTGGKRALRAVLPGLVLVFTFIPPPMALDVRLMVYLRGLAVQGSSRMLDLLGVIHALSGNVIDLPRRQLLVEEACSGINSVLLMLATSLFYLLWRRRSVWHILVCLPFVLAGVLLGNVIRICLGAWLQFFHRIDILSGWRHELVGLALLISYVTLIVSLDEWMKFLTWPVKAVPAPPPAPATPTGAGSPSWRVPQWALAMAVGFALLGTASLGVILFTHKKVFLLAGKSGLVAGATFSLPAHLGEWKRVDTAAPFHKAETQGIYSQIWNYHNGSCEASVALDYPFRGYHDVTECYRLAGWSIEEATRETGAGGTPNMVVEMSREPVSHGTLWFSTMDDTGQWLERPVVIKGWLERWKISGRVEPSSYRVQLLVTGYAPLQPAERESARQLFAEAREQLAQQLIKQLVGRP